MRLRPPAYGKELLARRAAGERVGLLVVALHDWDAGMWFDGRPEVGRVLLPEDTAVESVDWSVAMALDVLVCGSADDAVFYAACDALASAGAASVWGDFNDGIWLLERARRLWLAVDGPYDVRRLSGSLRLHREVMMMLRRGFYGSRVFDLARSAILKQMREVVA